GRRGTVDPMKRSTLVVSMMAAALLAAAACKKKEPAKTEGGASAAQGSNTANTANTAGAAGGQLEGQVDLIAWPGYTERGQTDKAYDWVTKFEQDTGCKVNVKTAATSDEMVALMNQGGYDLVTASGDASLRLIAGKKVQPV